MKDKPNVNEQGLEELKKVEKQIKTYQEQLKELRLDKSDLSKLKEEEPQTKMSTRQAQAADALVLKPIRTISRKSNFNEKFIDEYNHAAEPVRFIAENKMIIGEKIELWTGEFGGKALEFWEVPVNKVVIGPRYLADRIAKCRHSIFVMEKTVNSADGMGQYYGSMAVEQVVNRLDAKPVSSKKTLFMSSDF